MPGRKQENAGPIALHSDLEPPNEAGEFGSGETRHFQKQVSV